VIAAILLADTDLMLDGVAVALAPWEERETLIEWQIAQLQEAGAGVIQVVLGPHAERIIPLVSGNDVEPIVNDRWDEVRTGLVLAADGEAASLRVGATATPRNTTTAIIVWISRPRAAHMIKAVLDEHVAAGAKVSRLFSGDVLESPVCVDAEVLARMRNLPDGAGVDDVLREYDTLVVRVSGATPDLRAR